MIICRKFIFKDEAEVQEISNLLSTLYVSDPAHLKKQKKITKSEDKKRLRLSYLLVTKTYFVRSLHYFDSF